MRICATTASQNFELRNHPSAEILPDECLFEVFKCLPSGQERSVCACVSKRWLMLLSNIRKDEIAESNGIEGLAKLSIQGNNPCRGVTDTGLAAIARGCPTLRDLSLWNVSFVGDKVLSEIAHGKLETLSLVSCIGVGEYPLTLVDSCCNSLVALAIPKCHGVGNTTIDVVGGLCRKLTHIDRSVRLRIIDEGLIPLVQNCSANLVEVNLSGCGNITDISVSTIVKLNGGSLKCLLVDGCRHVTDATLVEILKSCWTLNVLDVSKSGIIDSRSKFWPVLYNFIYGSSHCLIVLLCGTIAYPSCSIWFRTFRA
ncbi:hypothetical protein KY284_026628 [Solanum tuberosum]|nr:hypothetical protein KY284_026628 [Solanum tuberosum]